MGLFGPRYRDGQSLDLPGLTVRLKVNPRARRISVRIDRLTGQAVATAPSQRLLADAADFARARQGWLAERLAEIPPPQADLLAGDVLTVLGTPWRLVADGRRPRLTIDADGAGARLTGCGQDAVDAQLVVRAVRRAAAEAFEARAARHCAALAAPLPPISLMDARTRWGSCTPAQARRAASIRLSWRLALAPFAVADYVVAHECAHLREANHGPRFWGHVHDLVGDHRPHRAWLRAHGADLHAMLPRGAPRTEPARPAEGAWGVGRRRA